MRQATAGYGFGIQLATGRLFIITKTIYGHIVSPEAFSNCRLCIRDTTAFWTVFLRKLLMKLLPKSVVKLLSNNCLFNNYMYNGRPLADNIAAGL